MHAMSILCSAADTVNFGNWPMLFKLLILSVAMCTVRLHLCYFCLSSVAHFSNTGARVSTSAERDPCFPMWRAMGFWHMVWITVMVIFWATLNKSWKQHPIKQLLFGYLPLISKTNKMNKTCRTLLEKQGWTNKWRCLIDPIKWNIMTACLIVLKVMKLPCTTRW